MITSSYAVYIRLIRMNSKLLVVVWCLSFSWNIMVQMNTDSNVFIKKKYLLTIVMRIQQTKGLI